MQENVLALFPGPTAGSLLAHTIKELRNNLVSPSSNIGTLQFFFELWQVPFLLTTYFSAAPFLCASANSKLNRTRNPTAMAISKH